MSDMAKPKKDWIQHQITAVITNKVSLFKNEYNLCKRQLDENWFIYCCCFEVFLLKFITIYALFM